MSRGQQFYRSSPSAESITFGKTPKIIAYNIPESSFQMYRASDYPTALFKLWLHDRAAGTITLFDISAKRGSGVGDQNFTAYEYPRRKTLA